MLRPAAIHARILIISAAASDNRHPAGARAAKAISMASLKFLAVVPIRICVAVASLTLAQGHGATAAFAQAESAAPSRATA